MLQLTRDWNRFAPKKRAPMGMGTDILLALLFSTPSKTKYKVIETHTFRSGITSRVVSKAFTFEDYLPAIRYIEYRDQHHARTDYAEVRSAKQHNGELFMVGFSIVYLYEN